MPSSYCIIILPYYHMLFNYHSLLTCLIGGRGRGGRRGQGREVGAGEGGRGRGGRGSGGMGRGGRGMGERGRGGRGGGGREGHGRVSHTCTFILYFHHFSMYLVRINLSALSIIYYLTIRNFLLLLLLSAH